MKLSSSYVFSIVLIPLLMMAFQHKKDHQKLDKQHTEESESWFKTELIAEKVWRIDDHGNDNIYLVEGEDKALLIDNGLGVADLKKHVKTITQKPLIVVNTHGHPDQVGGNF